MRFIVPDLRIRHMPASVTATVTGVNPGELLTFWFTSGGSSSKVGAVRADDQGEIDYVSINLDFYVDAGNYDFFVRRSNGEETHRTVVVAKNPLPTPRVAAADASPIEVADSLPPANGGVRRWVFQDLEPEGLGSWVMPANPRTMSSPHQGEVVEARHTTSSNGRAVLWHGGFAARDWTFSGYTNSRVVVNQLKAYSRLDHRFYIIDHRGRAWKTIITSFAPVPRRDYQGRKWMHDYQVSALIYNPQSPLTPV